MSKAERAQFQVQQLEETKFKKKFIDIPGLSFDTPDEAHQAIRKQELKNVIVIMKQKNGQEGR